MDQIHRQAISIIYWYKKEVSPANQTSPRARLEQQASAQREQEAAAQPGPQEFQTALVALVIQTIIWLKNGEGKNNLIRIIYGND